MRSDCKTRPEIPCNFIMLYYQLLPANTHEEHNKIFINIYFVLCLLLLTYCIISVTTPLLPWNADVQYTYAYPQLFFFY